MMVDWWLVRDDCNQYIEDSHKERGISFLTQAISLFSDSVNWHHRRLGLVGFVFPHEKVMYSEANYAAL